MTEPEVAAATIAALEVELLTPDPFELPLHVIRLPPALPCGLAPLTLYAIAATARNSHQRLEPILVRRGEDSGWELVDGRHRWFGSYVGGRSTIWCREEVAAR